MNCGNNNNDDYDDKTSESCPPFHRRIPLFFPPLTLTSGLPAALANPSLPHVPAGRKGEGHGKEQMRGGEMRTL